MDSPSSGLLENDVEVCKSDEWVVRVVVTVADLFQDGAEKRDAWTSNSECV